MDDQASVDLAAGSVTTLFVLDTASGGLTILPILDSAATPVAPGGGVQTGGGWLARAHDEPHALTPPLGVSRSSRCDPRVTR